MDAQSGPEIFFKILIAAVAGGAAATVIVTLWLERILAGWETIGLFAGCAVFTGLTIVSAQSPAYWPMLMAMVGIGVGSWIAGRVTERGLQRRLLEDDARKARAAVEFDFKNVAAHSLLGDVHAQRGQWDKAIEEYEISLELEPNQPEERFKLERAVRQLSMAEGRSRECKGCGAEWPKDAEACPECGRSGSLVVAASKWMSGGGVETLGWGALALLAVGVLLLAVQVMAAALVALGAALWLGSMALAGWRYWKPRE